MRKNFLKFFSFTALFLILCGCSFHLQSDLKLAPALHQLFLQTEDPYGYLSRSLREDLQSSHVNFTSSPETATAVLRIISENISQNLLSVGGTEQVKQYNLKISISFELTNGKGKVILPAENLEENRTITVQANQMLGGNNETVLFYQQMRRALASAILNRLASFEVSTMINKKT